MTASATDTNDLTFAIYEDGVMVVSCADNTSGSIIIPSEFNGKKVVKIADNAFENHSELTSVTIADSVREIGASAFAGCINLAEVVFSDNLEKIGADAFFACDALKTVILPDSLIEISPFAFFDCENLRHVAISDQIEIIPEGAFGECTNLTTISLPMSIKTVDYDAFINCSNIENVYYYGSYIAFDVIDWTEGNEAIYSDALKYNFLHTHQYTDTILIKAATCTEDGIIYNNACVCTHAFGKSQTTAFGHNKVSSPEIAPTCETAGQTSGIICTRCDMIFSGCEKIPATGHTATVLNAKEPTCTEDGYTEVTYCNVCDEILYGGETLTSLGHNWTVYSQTIADCTTGTLGNRTDICTNCKTTKVVTSGEKHPYGEWIIAVKATCTEAGLKYRMCTKAGCDAYEEALTELAPHSLYYTTSKEATCTSAGFTEGIICKICYETISEPGFIPAKGHYFITIQEVPATCTTSGNNKYSYCEVCGYYNHEAIEYPAKGHLASEWRITTAPTCNSSGYMKKQCIFCNMTMAEYTLDPLNHNYSKNWTTVLQPTCTNAGYAVKICSICSDIQGNTLSAIGHSDRNGDNKCDSCSQVLSANQNCSCNCHKGGLSGLLFKIINFFQKLLGQNKICACGASH